MSKSAIRTTIEIMAAVATIVGLIFYIIDRSKNTPPPDVYKVTETLPLTDALPNRTETPIITLTNTLTSTATSTVTLTPTQTNTPTLTSTSTPTLSLPFSDYFDTGIDLNNWEMLSGVWRTINGRLVADTDTSRNPSIIIVGDENWSNYVVEVDTFAESAAGYPVGIIVRSSKGKSLMFRTDCCDTDWVLIDGVSEQIIAHVDQGGLVFKLREFVKSRIRVEVIDQTFTGYIDGKLFLTVTDPTTKSGAVGLMSQTPFQNRLQFDNFTVSLP